MDIKHYYIEKGQGEPLILLHGNGENCDYFVGQTEAFAQKSEEAKLHAEMLGLMVNDPNVKPEELSKIQAKTHMSVFDKLLQDGDDKVRMEAPEIFRVLGFRVRVRDIRPPRHRRAFLVS